MKNFILALAAAGSVLCACNKEIVPERQVQSDTMEIGINSFNGTKGYVESELFADTPYNALHPHADADIETSARQMLVSSFLSPQDGTPGTYFKNADFRRSASDGLWHNFKNDAVVPIYWPLGGSLSFLALSVTNSLAEGQLVWNEENVAESFTLDAGDNFHQDDILFASISGRKVGVAPTVDMTFSHAQAWIEFQLTSSLADIVTIRKIELLDVYGKGKVTVYNNSGDAFAQWNFRNEKKANLRMDDIYNVCAAPLKVKGDDSTIGYMDMLIPEQPKTGFIVTYSFKGKPDELEFRHDLEHENWLMGNKYIYALDFDVNEITVDPSVTPFNAKPQIIHFSPDASYSINAVAGDVVNLPVTTLSPDAQFKIDWGDGTSTSYESSPSTKAADTDEDKITPSHTYIKPFRGNIKYYVDNGNITITGLRYDLDDISVSNTDRVLIEYIRALMFTADGEQTISIKKGGGAPDVLMDYSYDAITWNRWDRTAKTFGTEEHPQIYVRGRNSAISSGSDYASNRFVFSTNAPVECYGSVMHLLDYTKDLTELNSAYSFGCLFKECTALVRAPKLTAETTKDGAYYSMFEGCTSLTDAPELPATILGNFCYQYMFKGCTALKNVTEILPATTLARQCYLGMFMGCSALENAPALPATEVPYGVYQQLFSGCKSLKSAPALPASVVGEQAYDEMFAGCTALRTMPEMAAEIIGKDGCKYMFSSAGISSLPQKLKLKRVDESGMASMFKGCKSITETPEIEIEEIGKGALGQTFYECPSIKRINNITIDIVGASGLMNFTDAGPDYVGDLTFGHLGENACATMIGKSVKKSIGTIKVDSVEKYAMNYMFTAGSEQTTTPQLIVPDDIVLADYCFRGLFNTFVNITEAPELPKNATLAKGCYEYMFFQCMKLKKAPELPWPVLCEACYKDMFGSCYYLNEITIGATDVSATNCLEEWMYGINNPGTITVPAGTTWAVPGTNGIPGNWTVAYSE